MSRWLLAAAVLALASPAAAQDRWEKNKGDCEKTFRGWRTEPIEQLRECVMRWEMYRDVGQVQTDQRTVAQEAFDKLYQEGTDRDAVMALSALKRLGLRPSRLRQETGAVPVAPPPVEAAPVVQPEPVRAPEPPPSSDRAPDRRLADQHLRSGQGFFKSHQYPEALSEFLIAADADPTYAAPLYLAAMSYARMNQNKTAIDYLRNLKLLNSEQARQLLRRAARDPEFRALRAMATFKDLTGTAVIQILNGSGEKGAAKVKDYAARLDKAGLPVAAIGNDRNARHNIYIYTKPGYENQGEDIRRQLQLGMVHKRQIDWPSEYDIILIHGEPKAEEFIDDEAEKGAQALAEKKKKEEAAKAAADAKRQKEKDDMKKKMEMLKMLQAMDEPEQPVAPDPVDAVP